MCCAVLVSHYINWNLENSHACSEVVQPFSLAVSMLIQVKSMILMWSFTVVNAVLASLAQWKLLYSSMSWTRCCTVPSVRGRAPGNAPLRALALIQMYIIQYMPWVINVNLTIYLYFNVIETYIFLGARQFWCVMLWYYCGDLN